MGRNRSARVFLKDHTGSHPPSQVPWEEHFTGLELASRETCNRAKVPSLPQASVFLLCEMGVRALTSPSCGEDDAGLTLTKHSVDVLRDVPLW